MAQDPEEARLIRTAREVNDAKTDWVVSRILEEASRLQSALGRPIGVACLGLAYKPDVDDLRESPAVRVAREIKDAGIDVIACEPHIETHPVFELHTADDAIAQADLVAILVRHTEFLGRAFGEKPVLDFCGATRTAGDLARAAT